MTPSTATSEGPRFYCQLADPITYSASKDTPETVRGIRVHNGEYVSVCGAKAPDTRG